VQDPEKLARTLNDLAGPTHQALSGGLTFADNFRAEWHTTEPLYVPDDWVPLVLEPTWVNVVDWAPASIRKAADGQVRTRGLVLSATAAPTAVSQVPAAYLPEYTNSNVTRGDSLLAAVVVYTTGELRFAAGAATGFLSLDGISWMAADRSPIPPACFPYDFATAFQSEPEAVICTGYAEHEPTYRPRAALGAVDWELVTVAGKPHIRVNNVPGLIPGRKYRLTFLVVDR